MFKTLVTIGSIVGFIACAFVPPTDANFAVAAEKVADTAGEIQSLNLMKRSVKISTDPATFLSRFATSVHAVSAHAFTSEWKHMKNTGTEQLVEQLERIEWASRKTDVRLCGELAGDADVTLGDYLSLCVAIVTGDSARCEHLRALQDLCAAEFIRT